MRRGSSLLVIALLLGTMLRGRAATSPSVWFSPAPGTIDYVRLFQHPEEWRHARQLTSVFKFYQQHTQTPAPLIVGPNSYDALARAGAFRTVTQWRKKIAIEVGAVKEFYCTANASGMERAIAATLASVRAVEAAGGAVSYLALDEPFLAGQSGACGGPAMEPTADRLLVYERAVNQAFPRVRIGLIEAYPSFNPDAFAAMLQLLAARGVTPAFVHVDVDIKALQPGREDFARDMVRLKAVCAERQVPFGIIIWGYNGDADSLYAVDAGRLAGAVADAFGGGRLPDHIIFQSWAESSSGLLVTPSNLPEDRAHTHTQILWSIWRQLIGHT